MGHYFSLSIVSLCWLVFPSFLLQEFYVPQEMGVVPSVLGGARQVRNETE